MSVYLKGKVFYMNFTVHGHRVHRSTGEQEKEAALKVAQEAREEIKQETIRPKMLFSTAIDRCYEVRWAGMKSGERRLKAAEVCLKHLGDKRLDEISTSDISALRKTLEVGRKPATVLQYLITLHTVMTMAQEQWGLLKAIPVFPWPKVENRRFRVVTQAEEKEIVTFFDEYNPEMAVLVTVLADTGMRLSEALTLNAEDIDLATGRIHISESKTFLPRSVPMSDRVLSLVRRRTEPQLFSLSFAQAEWAWTLMRKSLGYDDDAQFVMNSFRHTFSSRLVQAGIDLLVVRSLLGFSTTEGTRRASRLSPESMSTVLFVLNSLNAVTPTHQAQGDLFPLHIAGMSL